MSTPRLNIHRFVPHSRANGPGTRAVVWVQGCGLACPGCFNPETHVFSGGEWLDVNDLAEKILSLGDTIEGVTISGGEPLAQIGAVTELLEQIRAKSKLSTLVFTGYDFAEVQQRRDAPRLLAVLDVLIAGRYRQEQRIANRLIGSGNKAVYFLTSRYQMNDLADTPTAEVWINADGEVSMSGIYPVDWNESP